MGNEHSHEEGGSDLEPQTLSANSLDAVAQYIKDGASNIVVLTGAGISTSAGIPDFRSPETGLYANLARLDLPWAEAVFDISYFREKPEPFYMLARELYPGKFVPTISHAFIALLSKKGKLRMLFTQNIDCLERAAGVPSDQIIEAHGSFATQRCIECKLEYPEDLMKEAIKTGEVPHCSKNPQHAGMEKDNICDGLVKPDIVFFGEQLPAVFYENLGVPEQADLMLIIGTSLSVAPFSALPGMAKIGVPRVLFNMEQVGNLGTRSDDVCVLGACDDGIRRLADALGWTEELEHLWAGLGGIKIPTEAPIGLEEEIDQIVQAVDECTLSGKPEDPEEGPLGHDEDAKEPQKEPVNATSSSTGSPDAASGNPNTTSGHDGGHTNGDSVPRKMTSPGSRTEEETVSSTSSPKSNI